MSQRDFGRFFPLDIYSVHFPNNNLQHLFERHCLQQNPCGNQYRDNLIDLFGETVIASLGDPETKRCSQDDEQTRPFLNKLMQLVEVAYNKGRFITYFQQNDKKKTLELIFLFVTDPGLIAIFSKVETKLTFKTAYFTHKQNTETPNLRKAIRDCVNKYADNGRLPKNDFKSRGSQSEVRFNIKFKDPRAFGFIHGNFNAKEIPL